MKKTLIAIGIAAVFAATQVKTAQARDCNFNPVGAAIGGFVAGAIIADAIQPRVVYVSTPAPVYCPPPAPVVCTPPVRVVYATPPPVVVYREPFVRVSYGHGYGRFGPHYRGGYCR